MLPGKSDPKFFSFGQNWYRSFSVCTVLVLELGSILRDMAALKLSSVV